MMRLERSRHTNTRDGSEAVETVGPISFFSQALQRPSPPALDPGRYDELPPMQTAGDVYNVDNGHCLGRIAPPNLESDMLGKGLLATSAGEPDPQKMRHTMEYVLAQNFPSEKEWKDMNSSEEKLAAISRAVNTAFDTIGLPPPPISIGTSENPRAKDENGHYSRGKWQVVLSKQSVGSKFDWSDWTMPFPAWQTLKLVSHECQHALQDFFLLSWFAAHSDSELPREVRNVKRVIYSDLEKPGISRVWELARKHPTIGNAQVKAMIDQLPRDVKLMANVHHDPSDENIAALYGEGVEKEAQIAGANAEACYSNPVARRSR